MNQYYTIKKKLLVFFLMVCMTVCAVATLNTVPAVAAAKN